MIYSRTQGGVVLSRVQERKRLVVALVGLGLVVSSVLRQGPALAQETPTLPPEVGAIVAPAATHVCATVGLVSLVGGMAVSTAQLPVDQALLQQAFGPIGDLCAAIPPVTESTVCPVETDLWVQLLTLPLPLPVRLPIPLPRIGPVAITVDMLRAVLAAGGGDPASLDGLAKGLGCTTPQLSPSVPTEPPSAPTEPGAGSGTDQGSSVADARDQTSPGASSISDLPMPSDEAVAAPATPGSGDVVAAPAAVPASTSNDGGIPLGVLMAAMAVMALGLWTRAGAARSAEG